MVVLSVSKVDSKYTSTTSEDVLKVFTPLTLNSSSTVFLVKFNM